MVEIGNEDNLGEGCESYAERFTAFYDAIHAAYPDLILIASTDNTSCLPSALPEGAWVDYHDYNTADGLVSQFNEFDNKDRSVPYFVGEYSRWEIDYPNIQGSVAEAVFMIGLERNSDVVKMAAYAPLLQLVDSTQWTVRFNFPVTPLAIHKPNRTARLDPLHPRPRQHNRNHQLLCPAALLR